jgi:uncharacterized membrane protein
MNEEYARPQGYPAYPAMPSALGPVQVLAPPPRLVTVAAVLLMVNLALSILATLLSFVYQDDIIRVTMEQTHSQVLSDAAARQAVVSSLWVRAGVNVLVGLLYLFFISRLYRGKRWAWRRLVWLSVGGCAGMIFLLTQRYPIVFKVEQVLQLLVLAAIAFCVLHRDTRQHYAKRPASAR